MKKTILLILTILFIGNVHGQDFTIDLSTSEGDTIKMPIETKKDFKIQIKNKLPLKNYTISVKSKLNPVPPLTLPTDLINMNDDTLSIGGMARCPELIEIIDSLYSAKSETDLPLIKNFIRLKKEQLEKEIKENGQSELGCLDYHISKIDYLLKSTEQILNPINVKKNTEIEIEITRKEGEKTKKWIYILETPKKGEWNVGYGFTFITQMFSEEGRYFLSQKDSTFIIKESNSKKILEFVPTIIFSYTPTKWANNTWSTSLIGGIGFDFEKPVVLFGGSLSYNQNLSLSIGVAAHEQNQLNGRYENEQVLKELISDDQLYESLYRINPFISVTFRFDRNPFKGK